MDTKRTALVGMMAKEFLNKEGGGDDRWKEAEMT